MVDYSVIIQKIFGTGTQITGIRPVFGGDINEAYLLLLSDGNRVFLKENTKGNVGFFETEKACLSAIRSTGTIRAPEVLETGICENRSYLMTIFPKVQFIVTTHSVIVINSIKSDNLILLRDTVPVQYDVNIEKRFRKWTACNTNPFGKFILI